MGKRLRLRWKVKVKGKTLDLNRFKST